MFELELGIYFEMAAKTLENRVCDEYHNIMLKSTTNHYSNFAPFNEIGKRQWSVGLSVSSNMCRAYELAM